MKTVIIKMSRKEALEYGLLVCKCGYPENNHFSTGKRECAHDKQCTGYREISRMGTLLKK